MQTETESGFYSWLDASVSEPRMLLEQKKGHGLKEQLEYEGSRPRTLSNVERAARHYCMLSSSEYIVRM